MTIRIIISKLRTRKHKYDDIMISRSFTTRQGSRKVKMILTSLFLLATTWTTLSAQQAPPHPHVILIVADDLGWNDVGFHGSNQIPTPNIDALAYNGVILHNYYVFTVCTPSRAALLTGRHPIHTGMQSNVLLAAEPRGLPLNETLLPQYLKRLGYRTHLVGKWHLGHFRREYTPTFRGFDSHLGHWTGHQDYFDHTAQEEPYQGLDMRRNMEPAWDLDGQYTTHVLTAESRRIIREHDPSQPLFLQLSHNAVHSANLADPIQPPHGTQDKYPHIPEETRRKYAVVTNELDISVGEVVQELHDTGLLKDSIVIFTTDNGGAPVGVDHNMGSNWPLRGGKITVYEGGLRGAALIWSPLISARNRVSNQMMQVTDWLPTILSAVGADFSLDNIDGHDLWDVLREGGPSPRTEVFHNIDPIYGSEAITVGDWKYIHFGGVEQMSGWYGPSGRNESIEYNVGEVLSSPAGLAVTDIVGPSLEPSDVEALRREATLNCPEAPTSWSNCRQPCLFNIKEDPCETKDVVKEFPEVYKEVAAVLDRYRSTMVPPGNKLWDERADPALWNNTWTNFGDEL